MSKKKTKKKLSSEIMHLGTTQPVDWVALVKKAALAESTGISDFLGRAMVDRAIAVLQLDHAETWSKLTVRKRGRPRLK
jgi:hypothetical protein